MNTDLTATLLSDVDTNRFGLRIGRSSIANSADVASVLKACHDEDLRMLIVRCRTDDFASLHALQSKGALLMDTLVYYQRNLLKGEMPAEKRPNIVRPVQPEDLPRLDLVARETFRGYMGHYHADPRLDHAKADEGYVEWAINMCHSPSKDTQDVLVAEYPAGTVGGFATLRMNHEGEGEGVLFGVHPSAEGRGIYWSFMVKAMEWCRQRGATKMVVSTQITNLAVQKVWARLGFELVRSYYTLHLWND
jgi:GNAT superfamily N-acetyltransferase